MVTVLHHSKSIISTKIRAGRLFTGLRDLWKKSAKARVIMANLVTSEVNREMVAYCKDTPATPFTKDELESFSWESRVQEAEQQMPIAHGILVAALGGGAQSDEKSVEI